MDHQLSHICCSCLEEHRTNEGHCHVIMVFDPVAFLRLCKTYLNLEFSVLPCLG
jgi:hypothetical protein